MITSITRLVLHVMSKISFNMEDPVIRIKIIGVGCSGIRALNMMAENAIPHVEFIAADTGISNLNKSKTTNRIQIVNEMVTGLRSTSNSDIGKQPTKETIKEIKTKLFRAQVLLLIAGMDEGTANSTVSIIAKTAKEMGILTIAIIIEPFELEDEYKREITKKRIIILENKVDSLFVIPRTKILDSKPSLGLEDEYWRFQDQLFQATTTILDIFTKDGVVGLGFNDLKNLMKDKGIALLGIGVGENNKEVLEATFKALNISLIPDISLKNSEDVLIHITAGYEFTVQDSKQIIALFIKKIGDETFILVGIVIDDKFDSKVRIAIIATGFNSNVKS